MLPPRPLRPFMNFTRLPARSGAVIRRVLEDDPEFRARVAASDVATEGNVGRPGWLFLHRPEGWEGELGRLVSEKGEIAKMAEEAAAEERAEKRLQQATIRIARLEAEAAAAQSRESDAAAELATARRARQAVAERAQRLEAELAEQRVEADRLRAELAAAQTAAEATAAEATSAAPDEVHAPPPVPEIAEPAVPEVPPPPAPSVDVDGLRDAIAHAAESLDAAAQAVDRAGSLLSAPPAESAAAPEPAPEPEPLRPEPALAPAPEPAEQPTERPRPTRPRPLGARRRPVPLPPGLLDDTVEAADHLVRAHGVVVLVDGYNATISSWPDLPLSEQRRRLVDALAELVARTGADAHVVFDGDQESPARPTPGSSRPTVRVLFSPADTPADDVILELIDRIPVHRPVVVASDDRRVQEGASARGANVLTRTQLLAMLRRGPSTGSTG